MNKSSQYCSMSLVFHLINTLYSIHQLIINPNVMHQYRQNLCRTVVQQDQSVTLASGTHSSLKTVVQVCEVWVIVGQSQHSLLDHGGLHVVVLEYNIFLQYLHSIHLFIIVQASQHHLYTCAHTNSSTLHFNGSKD